MSGHSKWATIKHKKGALDAKRGKLFSKIIKEITVAAKLGGGDVSTNPRLKLVIQKAKDNNLPSKNIDAAVKRGSGQDDSSNYEEITYEGYGPFGVAMVIECLTDNRNRSVADVRSTLSKNGGNLGESGSVAWQFEKKGLINIERNQMEDEDAMMEVAIEAGADDVQTEEDGYSITCEVPDFTNVVEALKAKELELANSEITFIPKNTVPVSSEQAEKINRLIDLLDDLDDVQSVSSNESLES